MLRILGTSVGLGSIVTSNFSQKSVGGLKKTQVTFLRKEFNFASPYIQLALKAFSRQLCHPYKK